MMVVIVVDLMLIQHIVLNVYAINTFDILLNKTKHATATYFVSILYNFTPNSKLMLPSATHSYKISYKLAILPHLMLCLFIKK
jgi:hypothetical protein